jgi:hypothetical protein
LKRVLVLILLVWLVSWVLTAQSNAQVSDYTSGTMGFTYQQFLPPGSDSGTVSLAGNSFATEIFPPGVTEVVGGLYGQVEGTYGVMAYGAIKRDALSMDLAVMYIQSTSPLTTGSYAVNPEEGILFAYARNMSIAEVPVVLTIETVLAFLESVTVDQVMASVTGSIDVSQVDESGFDATFSGGMLSDDETTTYTLSGGAVSLDAGVQANEELNWGDLKQIYR